MPLYPKRPQVVLVVGVNGSGKTTTIGKLASQFKAAGKNVVIAAGDTFRAAAVEQLQIWGDRAGVPVLTAPEGSDPASLAYDAMDKAQRDGADLLMIDTAGRLQNRADLMEELAKIVRVIRKKDESAPHNTLLVLDATTGQNALQQVKVFQEPMPAARYLLLVRRRAVDQDDVVVTTDIGQGGWIVPAIAERGKYVLGVVDVPQVVAVVLHGYDRHTAIRKVRRAEPAPELKQLRAELQDLLVAVHPVHVACELVLIVKQPIATGTHPLDLRLPADCPVVVTQVSLGRHVPLTLAVPFCVQPR